MLCCHCNSIWSLKMTIPHQTIPCTWTEWLEWAENPNRPGGLFGILKHGISIHRFPEISALIGCQQESSWHPEGDVFDHTVHVVNEAAGQGATIVFGALCHDFGKPKVTCFTP